MRNLIVLCIVASTCAQYNYQPTGHHGEAVLSTSNGAFDGAFASIPDGGISGLAAGSSNPSVAPQGDFPGAANDASALAPQGGVDTEIYTFSANDNDFNDNGAQQAVNSLKKNLRVVFIRAPENRGLEDAALALAKQAGDQQTAIYVLKKQTDIGDLANKLNNINQSGNNRPDVHFVKYRTPEDAANAQRAIQGQYDSLGGNSKNINGGVAPVLNFASSAPATPSYNSAATPDGPITSYIPPAASIRSAPTNSYIPPEPAAVPSASYIPAAPGPDPTNSYIPPASAADAPTTSYISPSQLAADTSSYIPPAPAPVTADLSTSYLPGSILRLFRL